MAGLAAASRARAAGLTTLVLEAGDRIGGRALTTRFGGAAFDHGASWLHAADRNPLADLARRHGDRLIDADHTGSSRLFVNDRPATPAEQAARDASAARYDATLTARACSTQPDISVAAAAAPLRADPWTATAEAWEAPIIAAADADQLSVRDWQRNALTGANLNVAGGLGAFVARRLGPPAGPVRTGCPVRGIRRSGGRAWIDTAHGTIEAASCIVTVSTGVLRARAIRFDPPLPAAHRQALDGLPMGLLTKVAIRAVTADRLGLPESTRIECRLEQPGAPFMLFHAWPRGADHVIGFIGGGAAWDLAAQDLAAQDRAAQDRAAQDQTARGEAASVTFARAELTRLLGHAADTLLRAEALVTGWANDPCFLGSYAYARPGAAEARTVLGQPVDDGVLLLAGEACDTDGLAGTVAGAYRSGQRAADQVLRFLRRG